MSQTHTDRLTGTPISTWTVPADFTVRREAPYFRGQRNMSSSLKKAIQLALTTSNPSAIDWLRTNVIEFSRRP